MYVDICMYVHVCICTMYMYVYLHTYTSTRVYLTTMIVYITTHY